MPARVIDLSPNTISFNDRVHPVVAGVMQSAASIANAIPQAAELRLQRDRYDTEQERLGRQEERQTLMDREAQARYEEGARREQEQTAYQRQAAQDAADRNLGLGLLSQARSLDQPLRLGAQRAPGRPAAPASAPASKDRDAQVRRVTEDYDRRLDAVVKDLVLTPEQKAARQASLEAEREAKLRDIIRPPEILSEDPFGEPFPPAGDLVDEGETDAPSAPGLYLDPARQQHADALRRQAYRLLKMQYPEAALMAAPAPAEAPAEAAPAEPGYVAPAEPTGTEPDPGFATEEQAAREFSSLRFDAVKAGAPPAPDALDRRAQEVQKQKYMQANQALEALLQQRNAALAVNPSQHYTIATENQFAPLIQEALARKQAEQDLLSEHIRQHGVLAR